LKYFWLAARAGAAGQGALNMTRAAPDGMINWRRLLAVAAVVAGAAAVCSPACAVEIFCSVLC